LVPRATESLAIATDSFSLLMKPEMAAFLSTAIAALRSVGFRRGWAREWGPTSGGRQRVLPCPHAAQWCEIRPPPLALCSAVVGASLVEEKKAKLEKELEKERRSRFEMNEMMSIVAKYR
jgi:hypothetical protein